MNKEPLVGKTLEEILSITQHLKMPRFTAKQLVNWLYNKRVGSIEEMTNLSKSNRDLLAQHYCVGYASPIDEMSSVDGTVKYLFGESASKAVEAVYIPDRERATLCVSSQVGCKMNCHFCMTGKQGFRAQLTAGDIINQIVSIPQSETLTNVVFMGMGEPMDNIDEVLKALSILTSEWGFAWSPRRITVSTVGVKKGLERFLEESQCHLAVSLHTPLPTQRAEIMPVEKAFSTLELLHTLRGYDFSKQRRLSFEYILFADFNDSLEHAARLAKLLAGIPCRINLIRFHAIPNVALNSSNEEAMVAFREYMNAHGFICTIRSSRGEDIFAACGMLSTAKMKK